MYIESEFALLEAQNEKLTRENKKLVAACKAMLPVIQYILTNGWGEAPPLLGTAFDEFKANELAVEALAPYQEECTCLPDLPDGRTNGGRGGCCPACEADTTDEIPY